MRRKLNFIKTTLASLLLVAAGCSNNSSTRAPTRQNGFTFDHGVNPGLQLNEPLDTVKETITEQDTRLLASYDLDSTIDRTRVHQYLNFKGTGLKPVFEENEEDVIAFFLKSEDRRDVHMFTYEIFFEEGFQANLNQTNYDGVTAEKMNILGDTYRVVSMAQFGDTYSLHLLREDGVELEIKDSNSRDNEFDNKFSLYINGELIEDASVRVHSTSVAPGQEEVNTIEIRLQADTRLGDLYVPKGHGISEFLDEPEGMLSDNWDIEYHGERADGSHDVRFVEK